MSVAATARYPNPWLAANCSLVFPGLGQLYRGQILKGSLMAIATGGLVSFLVWSIFAAEGNTVQGLWAIVSLITLYGWSIIDALHKNPVAPHRHRPEDHPLVPTILGMPRFCPRFYPA